MTTNLVPVRYVGFKTFKKDTVCGTLAIWRHHGDVQMVAPDVATRLLQFPTVWVDGGMEFAPMPAPAPVVVAPREIVEEAPPAPVAEAPKPEVLQDETPEGVATADEIEAVISKLDREKDFTDSGRPRVDAIREKLPGKIVAVADVKAAWAKFSGE